MDTASVIAPRQLARNSYSLDAATISDILHHARPLGHREEAAGLNLGFGFVYYGLVRALRPQHVVVIGSGYGFSVVCLALGLKDNGCGLLTFVDPSFSLLRDGPGKTVGGVNFWRDPEQIRSHFARFGVEDLVVHHKLTSEEFFARYGELSLPPIELAFIDGDHSYKHVLQDLVGTLQHSLKNSHILLHDTNIYIRELLRHAGVKRVLKRKIAPRKAAFEYVEFPLASGVAIVRVLEPQVWKQLAESSPVLAR
jgi:hypothetical protein